MTREVSGIPHEAQAEILAKLFDQMEIDRTEIDKILVRYGVVGDIDKLQRQYRTRKAQQLMSTLRDKEGRRSVLAAKGGKYVVVDVSHNRKQLAAIHARLQRHVAGLSVTTDKVKGRVETLEGFIKNFLPMG